MIYGQRPLAEALTTAPTWMWEEEAQQEYKNYIDYIDRYRNKNLEPADTFSEWLERSGVRLL